MLKIKGEIIFRAFLSKFNATTTIIVKKAMACTNAKSRVPIASAKRLPRPGQENKDGNHSRLTANTEIKRV